MTVPVRVRAAVAAAPPYVPGRRPSGTRRVARLASNELHLDLPVVAKPSSLRRYPEPTSLDLRVALGTALGVAPDAVVAGPGSVALCRLLIDTVCDPGDAVVFAWRSFEAYPQLTALADAVGVPVALTAAGEHNLPAMAAAITERTRLVFVCSPNNPTGPVVSPADFAAFLAAVPTDVLVVLDEAYVEFADGAGPDGLSLLTDHRNLLLLRTFSKAYGLAGARVGYAVGDPALCGLLRSAQVPFAVAQPSLDLAIAALEVDLAPRVAEIAAARAALVAWLAGRGLPVPAAHGNFVWLPLGPRSTSVAAALADRDVLVRPFAGEGVRITIGAPEEMTMLIAALAEVL